MINEIIEYFKSSYEINPIGQIVGFIGVFISIFALATKNDTKTKITLAIGALFWGVHFYLIGLYSAVAVMIIGSARNLASVKYKGNKKVMSFFIIILIVSGALTFKDIYSLFPITSGILASISFFTLSGIKMRTVILFCSTLWLTHNIFNYSIGGIVIEILLITTSIITISRLFLDKKRLTN